jgi:GNAT superfamily N-acetyltransferase
MVEIKERMSVVVSGETIWLNEYVDAERLEVLVKTDDGKIAGVAKITPVAPEKMEEVCTLTLFETSLQKKGIGGKMLSEVVEIAKNKNAMKIYVLPVPCELQIVDFRIEEGKVLSRDELYEIYQKLGFEFCGEDADISFTRKMVLKI